MQLRFQSNTGERGNTMRWAQWWPGNWERRQGYEIFVGLWALDLFKVFFGYYLINFNQVLDINSLQARKCKLRGLKHTQTKTVYSPLKVESRRADQTQCLMVLPRSQGRSNVPSQVSFVVSESFVLFCLVCMSCLRGEKFKRIHIELVTKQSFSYNKLA